MFCPRCPWLAGVIIGFALCSTAFAGENSEFGWVIIDARAFPTKGKQPTWIAIVSRPRRSGEVVRIPTRQTVVRLEAGKYKIIHIDFGESDDSGYDTVRINRKKFGHIEVIPDVITVVGVIDIKVAQKNHLDTLLGVGIHGTTEVLGWACARDPDLVARLPLRVAQRDGTYALRKIACKAE